MTLAKRLNDFERRLKALEGWRNGVDEAVAAEEAEEQPVERTLDGESFEAGERDQSQSLG